MFERSDGKTRVLMQSWENADVAFSFISKVLRTYGFEPRNTSAKIKTNDIVSGFSIDGAQWRWHEPIFPTLYKDSR